MIIFVFLIILVRNWASALHSPISLEKPGGQNVIVSMKDSTIPVINSVDEKDLSRDEIATILARKLKKFSTKSQAEVVAVLEKSGKDFQSFWISNQIFIKQASEGLIKSIEDLPEVKSVEKEELIPLKLGAISIGKEPGNEWHLEKMEVEKVWKKTRGKGVIVAIIDSGVRGSHEALRDNYIGSDNFGWYDPILFTKEPQDIGGHGSHVMGIIAGSQGIGAAPESKWMACRASITLMLQEHAIIACAQYILCPSDPSGNKSCTGIPHIINNSWGKSGGHPFFEQVVKAWNKVRIKIFFAAGNDGPDCKSMASPGDYDDVIGVGSTDKNDSLHDSSSRGPVIRRQSGGAKNETKKDKMVLIKGLFPKFRLGQEPIVTEKIKPNIIAPGVKIKSAFIIADNSYQLATGTSMASPAAAGVAALLLSIKPKMTLNELKILFYTTTDTDSLSKKPDNSLFAKKPEQCGDIPDDEFPNHFYGYGRINAYKAFKKLQKEMKVEKKERNKKALK